MAQSLKLNARFAGNPAFEAGQARARSNLRIGAELRSLREKSGLTQAELALKTGLDQADISRLESGKWGSRGISFDVLGRLLPVFGMRIAHEVKPQPGVKRFDADQVASASALTQYLHANS